MKLPFEVWLGEQTLIDDAIKLADEAIICYKNSAYRAALLFSYLMFQTIIKDRILKSKKPNHIDESAWNSLKQNLRKDEDWDKHAFQSTQRKENSIFLINDDLRRQVEYWKDRRNDCAHYKNNLITYAQVESFWQFLMSNLPKFRVNGGRESLLERIKIHFDDSYTKPGTDCSHLISEISLVVENPSLLEFYIEVDKIFTDLDPFYPYFHDNISIFWNYCLNDRTLQDSVIEFLKSDDMVELFMYTISRDPSKLAMFAIDTSFIRRIWRNELRKYTHLNTYWLIVHSFLIHNTISNDDKDLFFQTIIHKNMEEFTDMTLYNSLVAFGFDKAYRSYIFIDKKLSNRNYGYTFAHQNSKMITFFLKQHGLDKEIIEELNYIFKNMSYGTFLEELKRLFEQSPDLVDKYKQICNQFILEVPTYINSI